MKKIKEKNMKENMKKKIRLIGLMTVLALSFSCAQSNADNTPGPPAPEAELPGIVVYVLGADKTKGSQRVPYSDDEIVVRAEEGRELIFLVTTDLVEPFSFTYEVTTGSGPSAAKGVRVCRDDYDYEDVAAGSNTAMKGGYFPIQTYICPDDKVEFEEKFKVRILSGHASVENSPFEISVVIPNYDRALVSVENVEKMETVVVRDENNNNVEIGNTANIKVTVHNVDMPIAEKLIIDYEIRGVGGTNSVEIDDFVFEKDGSPAFPSGKIIFNDPISPPAKPTDPKPMESAEIKFKKDSIAEGTEEFEIFLRIGSAEHEGIVALANNLARGYILEMDPASIPKGCETSSTTRHPGAVEISTLAQLQAINTNDFTRSRHYILMNDIDADDTKNWNGGLGFQPIGRFITRCGANGSGQNYHAHLPFTGSFDGNGHTISNLYINRPRQDFIGLFGAAENAQICRLGLVNANITGWGYVGGISGWVALPTWKQYEDVLWESFVTGSVTAGHGIVGGLTGVHVGGGNIRRTYSTATVIAGDRVAGGLIGDQGYSETAVSDSYATGNVSGGSVVGGLVADAFSRITNSYSTGLVDGGEWTGGLLGRNWYRVANSYSASPLTLKPGRKGGLIGWNGGKDGHAEGLKINGKNYFLSPIGGGDDGVNSYGYNWRDYKLTGCPADRCIIATGNTDEERRNFLLKSLDETAMGWDPNIWGRLNSSTHFPCIKGLPIYDNSGMLGDKSACQ